MLPSKGWRFLSHFWKAPQRSTYGLHFSHWGDLNHCWAKFFSSEGKIESFKKNNNSWNHVGRSTSRLWRGSPANSPALCVFSRHSAWKTLLMHPSASFPSVSVSAPSFICLISPRLPLHSLRWHPVSPAFRHPFILPQFPFSIYIPFRGGTILTRRARHSLSFRSSLRLFVRFFLILWSFIIETWSAGFFPSVAPSLC